MRSLDVLTKRVDGLEKYISAELELKRKMIAEKSQQDLLSGLPLSQEAPKPSKKK
jgi:hypothetical protein